uniref:ACB domain-containing protein n=1 Tax=Strigamia maritima TaxID=126957 RepID=T1J7X7_STRMM
MTTTAAVPASTEELFNAAVDVIRDLPKNEVLYQITDDFKMYKKNCFSHISGAYQPSYQLMLRFYGFYKQATQGPCDQAKPAFWDVVGKGGVE